MVNLPFQVISEELFRNMGLALMTVFLVTLLVLANLWTCLLVFTCVGFTLVRVTRNFFRAHVIVIGRNGQCCSQVSLFLLPLRARERLGIPVVLTYVKPSLPYPVREFPYSSVLEYLAEQ